MASGKVHAQDSRFLAVASAPMAGAAATMMGYPTGGVVAAALLMAAGCAMGILFTPDLDVDHRTVAERVPIVGFFWFIIWWPYAKVLPHRSFHSHFPLWSTALRQLYFVSLIWLVGRLTGAEQADWLYFWEWLLVQWWYWWLVLGLLLSDIAHWLRDL